MVVGVCLMTLLIGIITASSVNDLIRKVMLDNAFQITEGLASQAVFPLLSGSEQNAQESMTQVMGFQSVMSAVLVMGDNTSSFSAGVKGDGITPDKVEAYFKLAKIFSPIETSIVNETEDFWLIKTPVKFSDVDDGDESEFELDSSTANEKTIGYVEIIYSKKNLLQTQRRIGIIIFIVGLGCVLVFSVLLHLGFIRLFKPLQRLGDTMKKTQDTGAYALAEIEGAKEIRQMAYAYNNMMQALQSQERALKQHRDHLEIEVTLRTQEFQKARDEAIVASQHKSEFMANMSHELRTPIQSILGYGELIAEELELEENYALLDDLEKITKNSTRLLVMINSLLDLAKIEAGQTDVTLATFSITELLSIIEETIHPLASKRNNSFSVSVGQDINLISTDKDKLEHVLINLLSNACKFTEDGSIALRVRKDSFNIYFDVEDTGIGLTEEQEEFIFDEFRQVETGNARKFGGTGLGLSISKKFVDLLQGTISVESQLGKGSVFTVQIFQVDSSVT